MMKRHVLWIVILCSAASSAGITLFFISFLAFQRLPVVVFDDADGSCLHVINYENGDAFNCTDLGGLLRNYHPITRLDTISDEKNSNN